MGKGDKKTRKGKIFMGSYGVKRKREKSNGFYVSSATKKIVEPVAIEESLPKKTSEKKEAIPKKTSSKVSPTKKASEKKNETEKVKNLK